MLTSRHSARRLRRRDRGRANNDHLESLTLCADLVAEIADGRTVGYNTDRIGFRRNFEDEHNAPGAPQ
jgi:hypothetical protein